MHMSSGATKRISSSTANIHIMHSMLPVILVACLLFCISSPGAAIRCTLENIVVTQDGTGEWAHGMPVYAVTVKNTCHCPQHHIMLACNGFNTTLEVDPSKFQSYGNDGFNTTLCLLNKGEPVVQGHAVKFSYAWSSQFLLPPVQSISSACR